MSLSATKTNCFRCAFTLVELLVTVAVIAILAAMLLPALARAKDQAHTVQCAGNLRQWGLALRMYADDFQDFLPRRGQGVQTLALITRGSDWFNALPVYFSQPAFQDLVATGKKPAAGDHNVFVCPDAADPGGTYFLCYGMNMNLSPWILPQPTKFGTVVRPDCVVALGESPGPYASTYPSTQAYSVVARHVRRGNLLFLAGQVQTFKGSYIGCGTGDPGHDELRWLTGTASDAQAHIY
jgi:prepilin-type N-terminal cleavage/methylation domain-containing protein